jgi:glyoxylase-like metal-dependent hydrolase (beta-lactamase superfamily II)
MGGQGPGVLTAGESAMFFKQLATKESSLSYFFGCGTKGKSMAVDVVAGDEEWYIEEAKKANVTINYVIDTHVHADHYSGKFKFEPLGDGQSLNLGNVEVEVLHTPGHTPDSICLLVTDMRRGELPWFVITGDTLFVGSTGRPDLLGREREMAAQLYDSIHAKLLHLSNEVEIFPGHQAGSVCGAGLSGKPSSTIGFEKRWNPGLAMDKAAFIESLIKEIPPRPAEMDRMVAANIAA